MPFENPATRKRAPDTVYRTPKKGNGQGGERVPSVTKILATMGNEALVNWANRQGLLGINIRDDYRARDIGTIAHLGIEYWLTGGDQKPDVERFDPDLLAPARHAVRNWRIWHEQHEVELLHKEVPLVHVALDYGGTFDCLARVDGVLSLLDWKSTQGSPVVWPSHFVQLSAYAELLRANDYPIPERLCVVSFSRDPKAEIPFREELVEDWEPHFRVFRAALELYTARLPIGF